MPRISNPYILLIVPPNILYSEYADPMFNKSYRKVDCHDSTTKYVALVKTDIPLGILSIAAYCKARMPSAEFSILDFNVLLNKANTVLASYDELYREGLKNARAAHGAPDVIGISALFSSQFPNVIALATLCKSIYPNTPVTVGGGVATNQYSCLFQATSAIDACCYGEGEIPMLELLLSDDFSTYFQESSSWATPGTIGKKTLTNTLLQELDDLPELDFSLCDLNGYVDYSIATSIIIDDIAEKGASAPHLHVMTSRGCPHRCCFCASFAIHGRKMRYNSIERVQRDFANYIEKYRPSCIVLQDDNFSCDKKRAFELLDFFSTLPVKVLFSSGLAMVNLTRDFLEKIKAVGVSQITLPIESGSDRVLRELMHKPLTTEIIRRVTGDCYDLGIRMNANILLGLPGETRQDIEDTRSFLKTLPIDWFYIYAATPLPGSEMHEICVANGFITKDLAESGYKKPVITTKEFTPEFIAETTYKMNLELNFVHNHAMRAGEYEFALTQFSKVFKVKEDHAMAHFMCGVCHERLGRVEEARESFRACRNCIGSDSGQKTYFEHFWPEMKTLSSLPESKACRVYFS